jgi:hypothetical protein
MQPVYDLQAGVGSRRLARLFKGRIRALFIEASSRAIEYLVASAQRLGGFAGASASPDVVLVPVALRITFLEGHSGVQVRFDFHGIDSFFESVSGYGRLILTGTFGHSVFASNPCFAGSYPGLRRQPGWCGF